MVWQLYDANNEPMVDKSGRLKGVAAKWSQAALATQPNDDFLLYYDGSIDH